MQPRTGSALYAILLSSRNFGEDTPVTAAEGLQSRTSGLFENITFGSHPDFDSKYFWTIDERGINIAPESTASAAERGNITHTNISSQACTR